jgi:hypothetical protein
VCDVPGASKAGDAEAPGWIAARALTARAPPARLETINFRFK